MKNTKKFGGVILPLKKVVRSKFHYCTSNCLNTLFDAANLDSTFFQVRLAGCENLIQ